MVSGEGPQREEDTIRRTDLWKYRLNLAFCFHGDYLTDLSEASMENVMPLLFSAVGYIPFSSRNWHH
jgi:hypothetical protein